MDENQRRVLLRQLRLPSARAALLGALLVAVVGASVGYFSVPRGARTPEHREEPTSADALFTHAAIDPDSKGRSLHEAAADGDLPSVQAQVASGVKLDLEDAAGKTAIEVAIEHQQVEVEYFLRRAESLLLFDESSDIQFAVDIVGGQYAYYTVFEPYPARSAIAQIERRLSDLGWVGQEQEMFNPQYPNSRVSGWSECRDATRTPPQWVRRWTAHWTKSDGAVLRVVLDNLRSDPNRLSLIAIYYPQSSP